MRKAASGGIVSVEWAPVDLLNKQFRACWRGVDPRQVEDFLREAAEEMQRLQVENAALKKDFQRQEKDLKEFREREKVIRNVLVSAQKTVEQMKANAEKEAEVIVAEAEVKAEKILRGAQQRLGKLHGEIADLKTQRARMELKVRAAIDACQLLLEGIARDDNEDGGVDAWEGVEGRSS